MAGIINKTERQIGIMLPSLGVGKNTVFLDPGFNVIPDKVWEVACKQKQVIPLLDGGVLVAGAKQTREEELMQKKIKDEVDSMIHEHPPTNAAASLIEGEATQAVAQDGSKPAVAVGAGANGADVVETKVEPNESDLLG